MKLKLFPVFLTVLFVAACTPNTNPENAITTYTMEEISQHSSKEDCWHLINGKVYDVTVYIESHPAGAGPMLAFCGKDATAAYQGIADGKGHSETADQIAEEYYLGNLEE